MKAPTDPCLRTSAYTPTLAFLQPPGRLGDDTVQRSIDDTCHVRKGVQR